MLASVIYLRAYHLMVVESAGHFEFVLNNRSATHQEKVLHVVMSTWDFFQNAMLGKNPMLT
jgi:hypothetical protein